MGKLHQNIFYYYKGASSKEKDVEQQIEDNTTKALINVLENSPIETQKLIIEGITGTEIPTSIRKLQYILQVKSIGEERIASMSNRFILAISPFGEIDDSDAKYEKSSRPDAWIWSSNFAILFENKTRGKLNKAQLEQHKLLIGNDRIVVKSWINDVYPVIREAASKVQNEKDRFLLSEFRRYLEVIGMSRFEGFDKEDFMKKYCDEDDREEFDYLRSKFNKLAEAVRKELKQKGLQFRDATSNFGEREIGWYGFYKDYKGHRGATYSRCENAPHFSIFMSAEPIGVCVKLHVMKQPLNDLRTKIKDYQKRKEFFELLKSLNSSDYKNNTKITVSESERSGKPRRSGDWGCEYTVYSGYIDKRRLETIAKMLLDNSKKVWFSIYYTFNSKKAEECGKNIVDDIVSIINEWWEIYSFIAESK